VIDDSSDYSILLLLLVIIIIIIIINNYHSDCGCNSESAEESQNGVDMVASENIVYKVDIKCFLAFKFE